MTEKQRVRAYIKNKQAELKETENKSDIIRQTVLKSGDYKKSDRIFIYLSVGTEPTTDEIIENAIKNGKKVFVPKCISKTEMLAVRINNTDELITGMYGIREPENTEETTTPDDIDLFIIPCVAASKGRKRLGHGNGYYDRFLENTRGLKMCLCFSDFLLEDLPTDENDIEMDTIITDEGII